MKITKSKKSEHDHVMITSATDYGTVYYKADLSDVKKIVDENSSLFVVYSIYEHGFDDIQIDQMPGSYIDKDTIYICVTDGKDLNINGEEVDPENAIEEVGLESVSAFIQDAPAEIVTQELDSYVFDLDNLEDCASWLLDNGYSLGAIVEAYNDYVGD